MNVVPSVEVDEELMFTLVDGIFCLHFFVFLSFHRLVRLYREYLSMALDRCNANLSKQLCFTLADLCYLSRPTTDRFAVNFG